MFRPRTSNQSTVPNASGTSTSHNTTNSSTGSSSSTSTCDVFRSTGSNSSSGNIHTGSSAINTTGSSTASILKEFSPHPKIRALQTHQWDHSVYRLTLPRTAYGASVVRTTTTHPPRDVILIGGGRGARPNNGLQQQRRSTSVLNSIEVFDPGLHTQAQLCPHRKLHIGRYSCGTVTVSDNVMCLLGGKNAANEYLDSVEFVTDTSVTMHDTDSGVALPIPMACFGVAQMGEKVYLIGGKSRVRTLTSVYEANLSDLVAASKGTLHLDHRTTIWTKVGTLASGTGLAPRHSFSLIPDGEVCWLMGGFDGSKLLNSVGLYHTKLSRYIDHTLKLDVARSGLTAFSLGKCIVVVGGMASRSNQTSMTGSHSDHSTQNSVTAELMLRLKNDPKKRTEVLVPVPYLDCPQKDQCVFQIGYKVFAIGQYNFGSGEPIATIPSMNVFDLREVFAMQQKVEGVVVANDFTFPTAPSDPAAPKMSPDVDKLKQSVEEWKKLIELKTSEYVTSVEDAMFTAQKMHDETVGSWKQELSKTQQTIRDSKPDQQNSCDYEVLHSKVEALRLEFERQKKKLEQETEDRIRRRNKEFEGQKVQCHNHIKKLEESITEYGSRLQQHQEVLQTRLVEWINTKKNDVTKMEGIVSGTITAPTEDVATREVDLTDDRNKIHRVFSGLDVEPAMVSKDYGRHCTNNFDVKNQIGVGGFGSVYQGNDVTLRCTFAFKRVSMTADNPDKLQGVLNTFQREISVSIVPNCTPQRPFSILPSKDKLTVLFDFSICI